MSGSTAFPPPSLVNTKPSSLFLRKLLELSLARIYGPPNSLPRASFTDFDVVLDRDELLPDNTLIFIVIIIIMTKKNSNNNINNNNKIA
jgi:hypothetical protein